MRVVDARRRPPRRSGPGRAGSAGRRRRRLVQPSGRSAFDVRSQRAPDVGDPPGAAARPADDQLEQLAGALLHHEHVAVAAGPRPGRRAGSGTARDRSRRRRRRRRSAPAAGLRARRRTGCRRPGSSRSRGAGCRRREPWMWAMIVRRVRGAPAASTTSWFHGVVGREHRAAADRVGPGRRASGRAATAGTAVRTVAGATRPSIGGRRRAAGIGARVGVATHAARRPAAATASSRHSPGRPTSERARCHPGQPGELSRRSGSSSGRAEVNGDLVDLVAGPLRADGAAGSRRPGRRRSRRRASARAGRTRAVANRQVRNWPSAVRRTRSQSPQNGLVTVGITPTVPPPSR